MHLKNILVPFDFSDSAINALSYAAELARHFESNIYLIHAYNLPFTRYEGTGEATKNLEKAGKYEKMQSEKIENLQSKIPILQNVYFEYHLKPGPLLDVITEEMNKDHIDLVIMGTEGGDHVENKILGSTAVNILRHTNTPVITVPRHQAFYKLDKIALAVDFQEIQNKAVFNPLIEIARKFEAEIHIVHVFKEKPNTDEIKAEKEIKKLDELLQGVQHSFYIAGDHDVDKQLERYILNNDIKLLAMLPHKHSFFERIIQKSHTENLAMHGIVPVMALYEENNN